MSKKIDNNKTYLFLYPRPVEEQIKNVRKGQLPSEILYGAIELIDIGWKIKFSDHRFTGRFSKLISKLNSYGIRLIDFKTIKEIASVDVVVVKDEFSLMLVLFAKLLGKKVVFFDSMFKLPQRWWRRLPVCISIFFADKLISYSEAQSKLWQDEFKFPPLKLVVLDYAIDTPFYKPVRKSAPIKNDYILSIGRDPGRDFSTLIKAVEGTDFKLKIVTLPYLLEGIDYDPSNISIYQRISYEELFHLYSGAAIVVIPLKKGTTYASGVRGLLEAMALKVPIIASRSTTLEQYVSDERNEVVFYNPGDILDLREKITTLFANSHQRKLISTTARKLVEEKYSLTAFVSRLKKALLNL